MSPKHVAVIDIGKTNAKLALVETAGFHEIAILTRPNTVLPGPPYPHFDVDGHWEFLLGALGQFHKDHGVDAICVTTHGASGALIGKDGALAAPILDYEHTGPDAVAAEYDALRPDFDETGSPRLSGGLNLGAQIHWQFLQDPGLRDRTEFIVTLPQYWAHRLCGVVACDMPSLGAHTDLWNPFERRYSSLADRLGILDKLAPVRASSDVLGSILPDVSRRTGLPADTPVLCGIHDSNASLLPHVLNRAPPFSVVSTGTWVIVMSMGGKDVALEAARDTLMNVNALGNPVPSARFMGGREFELVSGGRAADCDADVIARVADDGAMLMPAMVPECGPFQGRTSHWVGTEPQIGSPERAAALGFYLALMTAECLTMTGHRNTLIVEGPFARNAAYLTMLAAATGGPAEAVNGSTGTSTGAALLALGDMRAPQDAKVLRVDAPGSLAFAAYADRWRNAVYASDQL